MKSVPRRLTSSSEVVLFIASEMADFLAFFLDVFLPSRSFKQRPYAILT